MNISQTIQTALEVGAVAALVWLLFHERRVAVWELRTIRRIKRRFIK